MKCSFCKAKTEKIEKGWGRAKLVFDGKKVELIFCPKHRKEAEAKLDTVLLAND